MSIKLMTQVWESNVGPATKRLVLLALADSANDEGVCWPSVATIARKAGASKRRTEEVMAELVADRIVAKQARWNDSNVYTLSLADLPRDTGEQTPRENRTPRENVGDPPAKSAQTPRENTRTNRKRTTREPSSSDADAPDIDPPSLPLPGVDDELARRRAAKDEETAKAPTLNQRAVRLAQAHYERLGKMGNVPAWVKIIRKALEHDYQDQQVDRVLAWIADRNWSLTEERLANALRGGPRPAGNTAPPTTTNRPQPRTGGMVIEGPAAT
jgi:hypothetical protein